MAHARGGPTCNVTETPRPSSTAGRRGLWPRVSMWFPGGMAVDSEFTIDELARESGMTVRTLRVYNERGLLPPPQLKGRTGFYSEEHLNRVRIISRLLDRGIKLNGVRDLLEAWDRGDDLAAVLGVSASASAPATPPPSRPVAAAIETTVA